MLKTQQPNGALGASLLDGPNNIRWRHLAPPNGTIGEEEDPASGEQDEEAADGRRPEAGDKRPANGSLANGDQHPHADQAQTDAPEFKAEWVWTNIVLFIILHSFIPVAIYLGATQRPWKTLTWMMFCVYASGLGVTGGCHRLWSHKAYKARLPVEVLLMILQTMAGQNSIYTWSRDHRVHHKFAETDADPHNIKRGFFFAHMGWLCCRKHPDVKTRGATIDMSDLEANPVVMFQHKHFWWLSVVFNLLLPTVVPVWLWRERVWTSFVLSFAARYMITLHGTWLVNSAAHYYGERPYDKHMEARESPAVIWTALGEGFHNYHHTFPFDYSTSEFGKYLNITTIFIDLCAALGLVYERRKVDKDTILRRQMRTGDATGQQRARQLANGAHTKLANGAPAPDAGAKTKRTELEDEPDAGIVASGADNPLAPLNNMILELPYISGLTSMKYTM